jgi:RHS repeat-associated protein
VGRYYPYGEDRDNTANDAVKFATYTRDAVSGLDYADQRYFSSMNARFTTSDPLDASASVQSPGSWNRYSYALNDPVNGMDPLGLFELITTAPASQILTTQQVCAMSPMYSMCIGYAGNAISVALLSMQSTSKPQWDALAKSELANIASGSFRSKPQCDKFFASLAAAGGVSEASLEDAVVKTATDSENYVYDGVGSSTLLTQPSFPNVASPGVSTVGQWFAANPGAQALSQFNGSAIWINAGDWGPQLGGLVSSTFSGNYGLGTLLHELLHKQSVDGGFTHDQMAAALAAAGISPGDYGLGRNAISDQLGRICF